MRIRSYSGQHFLPFGLNTKILRICPYSVRMREKADQNNSEYGHFSCSVGGPKKNFFELLVSISNVLMRPNFTLIVFLTIKVHYCYHLNSCVIHSSLPQRKKLKRDFYHITMFFFELTIWNLSESAVINK